jgi:DNA replication protein DnaC
MRLDIDEIGYLPTSREHTNLFFQVVAQRYERILARAKRARLLWT